MPSAQSKRVLPRIENLDVRLPFHAGHTYVHNEALPADVNLDSQIDIKDVLATIHEFQATEGSQALPGAFDVNNDAALDISDILLVVNAFGTTTIVSKPAEELFHRSDLNLDGSLSGQEFADANFFEISESMLQYPDIDSGTTYLFHRLDTDDDGLVSKDELCSASPKFRNDPNATLLLTELVEALSNEWNETNRWVYGSDHCPPCGMG